MVQKWINIGVDQIINFLIIRSTFSLKKKYQGKTHKKTQ